MCQFKSGIILKDRVFVSDYDSHTDILKELNIEDNQKNAEKLFVQVELIPENGDIFSDIGEWKLNVNQDIIPEWFVKEYEKIRMITAVKEWAKKHIFVGKDDLELKDGTFYLKDCKNARFYNNSISEHHGNSISEHYNNSISVHYDNSISVHYDNSTSEHHDNSISEHHGNSISEHYNNSISVHYDNSISVHYDNSTSEHHDNSTSEYYDNSTSEHYDNSTSEHYDNSISKHYGNSTSKHYGNSTSVHHGNSTAIITQYSSNTKENIVLCDNSTLKDGRTKTIYQSGDWKLVLVNED